MKISFGKKGNFFCEFDDDSEIQTPPTDHSRHIVYPANHWVCCDFMSRRIASTHYSTRPGIWGDGAVHLKNWYVEVSNDGAN
jgi:hypothetical protein